MERTTDKRVFFVANIKRKNPETTRVTGFFDGGSGGFEPLHGTRWTVSVTKQFGN